MTHIDQDRHEFVKPVVGWKIREGLRMSTFFDLCRYAFPLDVVAEKVKIAEWRSKIRFFFILVIMFHEERRFDFDNVVIRC